MSQSLPKVKILLDRTESSNRLHAIALDRETQSYLSIRVSSPEEIIERVIKHNYKDILNAYMLFMIDFQTAFKEAKKSNKQFRNNSKSFKKPLLFWGASQNEARDEYIRIFKNYKKLKPKGRDFIHFCPRKNASNNNETEFENLKGQDNSPNNANSFTPQPETEVTLGQDTSNNFLQSEIIQGYTVNTQDLDNLPNYTNNLIPQSETIQFENFEITLDQNNLSNNFLQSEAIRYPSYDNVYFTEDYGNLFYLDRDNSFDNLIFQPESEDSEMALDQSNYTNDFTLQSEVIQYPSVDFENGNSFH